MGQQFSACVNPKIAGGRSAEDSSQPLLEQDYARIKQECLRSGKLFEDPLFPAASKSLHFQSTSKLQRQWMRPKEISAQFGMRPEFYVGGGAASDLVQGILGNCWIVAAASSLADHPQLLDRVASSDQSFHESDYAGIFRFNFYVYGRWVEVVVDDRLPTDHGRMVYVHSSQPNEFWGALLEKAYAKLLGCYESLTGGKCADALTSLTGGVTETYRLKSDTPRRIGSMLLQAVEIGSLTCTGIWGTENVEMENGLVIGHAYSVIDVQQIEMLNGNGRITLIRLRNPWGNSVEWRGRWSDRSRAWRYVAEDVRMKLHQVQDNGQFWMDLNDLVRNFDQVDICHMTPDSAPNSTLQRWQAVAMHGAWIKDESAGGRLKYYDSFASNPQYEIQIGDTDVAEKRFISAIIELTQKRCRSREQHYPLYIGYFLYQLHDDHVPPMPTLFFQEQPRIGAVDSYSNSRTVTKRFTMPAGRYLIIPSTWDPDEEGHFLLRVWSQSPIRSISDGTTSSSSYSYPNWNSTRDRARVQSNVESGRGGEQIRNGVKQPLLPFEQIYGYGNGGVVAEENPKIFTRMSTQLSDVQNRSAFKILKSYAGKDMTLNAAQLQRGLNASYAKSKTYRLLLDCCRSLIATVDNESRFKIYSDEFLILYSFLEAWTETFRSHDKKRHGYIYKDEFANSLYELNLLPLRHTSNELSSDMNRSRLGNSSQKNPAAAQHESWLSAIFQRFCDRTGRVSYSEFINCCSKLLTVDSLLAERKSRYADGVYSVTADQVLLTLLKT